MAIVIGANPNQNTGAPKPKPPKTPSSSLATSLLPDNSTVGSAAATGGFGGIAAAFPSFVANPGAPPATNAPALPDPAAAGAAAGVYTPTDWNAELSNDPTLAAAVRSFGANDTTYAANLHAQRAQALAQFGFIPANLSGQLTGDVNADVDPITRGLADAATAGGVSTYAQLQKARNDANKANYASLAARGLIHSGAAGQHANEVTLAYDQAYEQSTQKLMDYLAGAYQQYLGYKAQGQTQLADATNQALQRIIARIQANQYAQQQAQAAAAAAAAQQAQAAELQRILAQAAQGSGAPGNVIDQPPYNPPPPEDQPTYAPPEYGPDAGYTPEGTVTAPQTITAPGGGVYRSGGGVVTYQSKKGTYGGKALI